jgi:hypothetical protein
MYRLGNWQNLVASPRAVNSQGLRADYIREQVLSNSSALHEREGERIQPADKSRDFRLFEKPVLQTAASLSELVMVSLVALSVSFHSFAWIAAIIRNSLPPCITIAGDMPNPFTCGKSSQGKHARLQ